MGALVVFESMFGCTQSIAEAVGDGLTAAHIPAEVVEVGRAAGHDVAVARADLLVIGAPTHMRGMSTPRTRALARTRSDDLVSTDLGVHEWLDALPGLSGRLVAVFDTRSGARFAGSAGERIERLLRKRNARLVAPVQAFGVISKDDGTAELGPGQLELAKAWGATLAGALASAI
ncbi:flavodoxin family protein [Cellulomonas composti]|uniref:Flavodoxin n=1 Tax=Cellulomonas composti TaxID=266130 RepID=A0A511JC42_9CELL|nr:flavodoxin domain-containing protein [Cellulomonas composti]GEL95556.1 flavodoxin [Cellulomonas composti]